MERRGISIDRQVLSRLSGEFAQRAGALEAEIKELAGGPLNPGSPKQLGDILFGKMGLPGGTKTKTGAVVDWRVACSMNSPSGPRVAAEDPRLASGHEAQIDLHRRAAGLRQSDDASRAHVATRWQRQRPGGCRRPSRTCRTSRSAPRRAARSAAPSSRTPGTKLVSADYSQIELRLLAEIADIPTLRKAFRDGLDIHAMTASEMFGVPVKDMPPDVRRRAKAINFGIIYGISAFGLANQLGIAREEAGAYIKKYFERFPGIRAYMEETKAFCKQNGYVLDPVRAQVPLPGHRQRNPSIRAFNERAAINARLQGTAADIIRRAMIRMDGELKKHKLTGHMLLQVHDELIFEVPDGEVAKTLPVVSAGDGTCAAAGDLAVGAAARRCARGEQLGRGALVYSC